MKDFGADLLVEAGEFNQTIAKIDRLSKYPTSTDIRSICFYCLSMLSQNRKCENKLSELGWDVSINS